MIPATIQLAYYSEKTTTNNTRNDYGHGPVNFIKTTAGSHLASGSQFDVT